MLPELISDANQVESYGHVIIKYSVRRFKYNNCENWARKSASRIIQKLAKSQFTFILVHSRNGMHMLHKQWILKTQESKAGERAQWLRALAMLEKDLNLVSRLTSGDSLSLPVTPVLGDPTFTTLICTYMYLDLHTYFFIWKRSFFKQYY